MYSSSSRVFGALLHAIFQDRMLSVTTKRLVYQACVVKTKCTIVQKGVLDTIQATSCSSEPFSPSVY